MIESFHFLQPLWLLALLPLALLVWLLLRRRGEENPWRRVVDPAMLQLLGVEGKGGRQHLLPLWLLATGWAMAIVALANPSWDQQSRPLLQSGEARVLVLDLSSSMLASDLRPSRLQRAQFKVADILARQEVGASEGLNGLVVFAGDAFAVAPLSRDEETILAMLKALDPLIMPVQGSRMDLGLLKAGELLQQAGVAQGEILVIGDGYTEGETLAVAADLRGLGYRVSVLGIGTAEGAPVPIGNGNFLRDDAGAVVVPKLDTAALQALAAAGGGVYASIRDDQGDLDKVLQKDRALLQDQLDETQLESEIWIERGPWLVPLLLPLAALAFRRGWLLILLLLIGTGLPPRDALAFDWQDLWQRREQQAAAALEAGDSERAAELADDPLRRGVAQYRSGDYQEALDAFGQAGGSDAAYNRGNALARLGEYQEAIQAYDKALEAAPNMEDAQFNKEAVEKLLQQQKQQQSSQGSNQDSSQSDEKSEQGQSASQKDQQQGGESSDNRQEQGMEDEEAQGSQDTTKQQGNDATQSPDENQFADALKQEAEQSQEPADQTGSSEAEVSAEESDAANDAPEQQKPTPGQQTSSEGGENDAGAVESETVLAEDLSSEEQIAAEQWLRRIPDDPGGLLRRKFLYQYRQRTPPESTTSQQPW